MTPWLRPGEGGAILEILVQPRASRNEIIGIQDGALKVRLTSPPVDGAANLTCREFLAKKLGVVKGRVVLVAGDKSRHKRLFISGMTVDEIRPILG